MPYWVYAKILDGLLKRPHSTQLQSFIRIHSKPFTLSHATKYITSWVEVIKRHENSFWFKNQMKWVLKGSNV